MFIFHSLLQLKQFLKTCSVSNYTKKMRQLLEKIEENSKFIERERAKISFSLSEDKMVAAWETSIRTKGTPLQTFFENWSKINRIQKRKKITKNDEIAGELPKIKRVKLSDDAMQNAQAEDKGPVELFPSDDEEEDDHFKMDDDDTPAPKVKMTKKKEKKNVKKKATKKKVVDMDDHTVDDKDDIVQEFSVNDW